MVSSFKKKIVSLLLCLCTIICKAQLVVTPGVGVAAVATSLGGGGLTISNVTINCPTNAYGTFVNTGTVSGLGIPNGLVLTTSDVSTLPGPGNQNDDFTTDNGTTSTDAQLAAIAGTTDLYDPCIIEFDVIPQCNKINLVFVFGSDEYTNYVSAGFNDAFGFFVTGPNPLGGNYTNKNIATLPNGTTIVSIDNVNTTTNPAFFKDNNSGTYANHFDGFTTVLSPSIDVVPCATYHFKIGIVDVADGLMDSGVLLDVIQCTAPWSLAGTSTPASCGANDGSATVSVTGGIGPFTYSWAPAGGTAATATGIPAGTYIVTVDDGLSCSPPKKDTIVVGGSGAPLPTVPANITVCTGTTVPASAFTSTPAGATFDWTNSNTAIGLVAANTGNTPSFTAINTGTAAISGTVSVTATLAGCVSAPSTYTITVNPQPILTTISDTICMGTTATLSVAGAATYSWTPSASPLTGASVSVNPTTTTNYTVIGTDASTCSDTAFATVVVNPLPVVTGSANPICVNDTAVLTATGALTYTWLPATMPATGATVGATPTTTTIYTVTGTDANACTDTALVTVVVNSTLTLTVNSPSICIGDSATVTATGANTYTWTAGTNPATGSSVVASPATTTSYTVTGTSTSGCVGSATATVTVNPLPPINALANPAGVCLGSSTSLSATGGTLYAWTGTPAPQTGTPITVSPLTTSTYTLTGTDANGCINKDSVTVTVFPVVQVVADPDKVITCATASVTFGATTAVVNPAYTWTGPSGFTSVTTPTVSTSLFGQFIVQVQDPLTGCKGYDSLLVIPDTTHPVAHVQINGNSPCFVGSIAINGTSSVAGSIFFWNGPQTFSAVTPTITASIPGTYTLSVADPGNGCIDSDTISVYLKPQVTVNSGEICAGASITLTASGASAYHWSTNATTPGIQVSPPLTTSYTVIGSSTNNCKDTAIALVTVDPIPATSFSLSSEEISELDPTLYVLNTSTGDSAFYWTVDTHDTLILGSFPYDFNVIGEHQVCLYTVSNKGCKNQLCKNLIVRPEWAIYFPNAFTPDTKDNINDTYVPKGFNIRDFEMWIYDRWGNMIFYSDDINKAWDGKVQNKSGEIVQQDVYVYKALVRDAFDKKHQYVGTITVAR